MMQYMKAYVQGACCTGLNLGVEHGIIFHGEAVRGVECLYLKVDCPQYNDHIPLIYCPFCGRHLEKALNEEQD